MAMVLIVIGNVFVDIMGQTQPKQSSQPPCAGALLEGLPSLLQQRELVSWFISIGRLVEDGQSRCLTAVRRGACTINPTF